MGETDSAIGFRPQTAREALLAVVVEAQEGCQGLGDDEIILRMEGLARQGLDCTAPGNFEYSDHLADRLAKAIRALRGVSDRVTCDWPPELVRQISEALVLPPDIEATIEVRGRG